MKNSTTKLCVYESPQGWYFAESFWDYWAEEFAPEVEHELTDCIYYSTKKLALLALKLFKQQNISLIDESDLPF